MSTPSHSKIISRVAKEMLSPIGVIRKGRSRTWLDDNGWWVTVIEFQPSRSAKGTYLNVGVNFQWYPKEYFSFDIGYREAGFVEYKSDEQFEAAALGFSELAKLKILEIRKRLLTPKTSKKFIRSSLKSKKHSLWAEFHQGMAFGVAGDTKKAESYFKKVLDNPHDTEWAIELKLFTTEVMAFLEVKEDFLTRVDEIVHMSRELKNLGPSGRKIVDFVLEKSP